MRISDWSSDVCSSDLAEQRCYRIRPTLSTLALALALAGCATPDPGANANNNPSQLVVHTSTGNGWQQEGRRSTSTKPVPESRTRTRRLTPTAANPGTEGPTLTAEPTSDAPGNDIMLHFVEADLHGVVRALARFTGDRTSPRMTPVTNAHL